VLDLPEIGHTETPMKALLTDYRRSVRHTGRHSAAELRMRNRIRAWSICATCAKLSRSNKLQRTCCTAAFARECNSPNFHAVESGRSRKIAFVPRLEWI
jgi:hypothetical protein